MKSLIVSTLIVCTFLYSCKKKEESPAPSQSATSQCTITRVITSSNDTVRGSVIFTYDNLGNLIKEVDSTEGEYDISYYSYDDQNRLVQYKLMISDGSPEDWESTTNYKYDSLGRLSEKIFANVSGIYDSTVYQYISSIKALSVKYGWDTVTTIYIADANGNLIKTLSNEVTGYINKDSFIVAKEFEYYFYSMPSDYELLLADPAPFPAKQLEKSETSYNYGLANNIISAPIVTTETYTYKFDNDGKLIQYTDDYGELDIYDFVYTCK